MSDTTHDSHICDVGEPLVSQTRCPNWADLIRRCFWVNSITKMYMMVFLCMLWLCTGSGPVNCPDGICNRIPVSGQHGNQSIITAASLLSLPVPPELQHYEDPLWRREKASELASAWGFLSGQLLFASVAGRVPK